MWKESRFPEQALLYGCWDHLYKRDRYGQQAGSLSITSQSNPSKATTQVPKTMLFKLETYKVSRRPSRGISLLDILDQFFPPICMQDRQTEIRCPIFNRRLARVFIFPDTLRTVRGGFEDLLLILSGVVIRPQVIKPLTIRVLENRHNGYERLYMK